MIVKNKFLIWICFVGYVNFTIGQFQKTKTKAVTTHLTAKWPDTSLLLEAAEFLSDESPATFWQFLDSTVNVNFTEHHAMSEEEHFMQLISLAGRFLSPSLIGILKFSLSLRIYSPKIEMFRQMALDRGIPPDLSCDIVADVNGNLVCDIEKVNISEAEMAGKMPTIFEVDHTFPGGTNEKVGVVLYGDPACAKFLRFHSKLKELSSQGFINYIFRPFIKDPSGSKVRLSGYGVELQIKSTEYKAQDDTKLQDVEAGGREEQESEKEVEGFIFPKLKSLHPELVDSLNGFRSHLVAFDHEMAPLKVWQLQHLSMQASQRIMSAAANERLELLTHIAQNFPSLAKSLIKIKVDDKLKKEIIKNQNYLKSNADIQPGDAALFVNGMHFDIDYLDVHTLLDQIRNEQRAMEGIFKLGIEGTPLKKLLSLDISESKQEYGIDIRDSAVIWLNNIEMDSAYRKWPSSMGELLRPTFPGMLRNICKNFHNFVIIGDPSKPATADIYQLFEGFLSHSSPFRVGLVFSVNSDKKVSGKDDAGVAILCAFNFIIENEDRFEMAAQKGLQFLLNLYSASDNGITPEKVISFFKSQYPNEDDSDIFGEDSDYDVGRQLAKDFVEKGGFKNFPQVLMNGIPLPEKHLSGEDLEEVVLMEVMRNSQVLQRAVYKGELDDSKDVVDWLMSVPNIMPRLNERVLSQKHVRYLDMAGADSEIFTDFKELNAADMTAVVSHNCRYMVAKVDPVVQRPLSLWIVGDFETPHGRELLMEALKFSRESDQARICVLHNTNVPSKFSRAVEVAVSTLPSPVARHFLLKILDPVNSKKINDASKTLLDFRVPEMETDAFKLAMETLSTDVFERHFVFITKVLGLAPGQRTVIANGRMLGAFSESEKFLLEDFSLIERHLMPLFIEKIASLINGLELPFSVDRSDLIMKACGVLQTKPQSKIRTQISIRGDVYSVIKIPPSEPMQPSFDIIAICDPASEEAQKLGPVLQVLKEVINADVKIILNPLEKHSEMPLKSYYRYVLEASPLFSESGERLPGPSARFTGLPETPILTQNFHVPENWLVEAVRSVYDLDNIKLADVESSVHSEFELEYLLLEGHCFEQSTGNPPRGLQFTLGTQKEMVKVDTIVMANLGYFQLKSNPGAWILRLREGRSADIYNIASHEGTDTPVGSDDVMITISSFKSHIIKVRVAKKPKMQHLDLLSEDGDDSGGLWNSIASSFGGGKTEAPDEVVNIFSVASGHLYERFLRIMTVSVVRHTSRPVKFWFIKNFLSPTFKDSLPILAKELGFEYELVQYKWPRWLHQQTEKQRIIWGYKILFLDVLFPLSVKKIIFVDADQIVRSDIGELSDTSLDGAPYGFVPFCDSRKEMEGFRFWKQGYWRNHLAGRKYHISALFVVDLKKFRQIAAGDRLRGQYQGLSQDPNSLSNLDQDLPNNMIHQVRIKSLPMEWLWCETWCDDASKSYAKIIDLCNNPMTKEAKLDAAQRIVEEWGQYDNEVKVILAGTRNSSHKLSVHSDTHEEL